MPFTFSHPAIVLPLINKRWKIFSVTGLIIGSIIPDFESFINLNVDKPYSHTWLGIFWFDLPLAVICSFVFHNIVRDILIHNLPDFIMSKFIGFINFRWNIFFKKHFLIVIFSMLTGIFSHLLWDSITHLSVKYPGINDSKMAVYNNELREALQNGSSVIGLFIIIWYIVKMPKGYYEMEVGYFRIERKNKILFWFMVAVISSLIIVLLFSNLEKPINIILKIDIIITGVLSALLTIAIIKKILCNGGL